MLSFAQIWSFSVLPDAYTLATTPRCSRTRSGMIGNTLLYCGLAALIDVVIGTAIAYLILRTRIPGAAVARLPGERRDRGARHRAGDRLPAHLPGRSRSGGVPLTQTWVLIMLAYAVRRLPYALRSCMAALQQIHVALEEAAEMLGASSGARVRRIVIPLMAGGILAGFVSSFITAAVELSATILLVVRESQAPMSYGIYLYMQSVAGRGPGAALGVLRSLLVAVGTFLSHWIVERGQHDTLEHAR